MTDRIASTEPISAPPYDTTENKEVYDNQLEAPDQSWVDAAYARQAITDARVPVREMMRISNRFNYSQYYLVPARVGVKVLDQLMDELFREGCKLSDIQVTFEIQEVK